MFYSRRHVVKSTGIVALGTHLARPSIAFAKTANPVMPEEVNQREVINAAIDAAMSAGATYADARLSHSISGSIAGEYPSRAESLAFGVRVLYDNYWGFAASPYWSEGEAVRMGLAAIAQAKANTSFPAEEHVELAPSTDSSSGHWDQPIKHDPFQISPDELDDFAKGLIDYTSKLKYVRNVMRGVPDFSKIYKAFGSSQGQHTSQNLFSANLELGIGLKDYSDNRTAGGELEGYFHAGEGFEYVRDRPLREDVKIMHQEALEDMDLPYKPIDAGRYDVLIDQVGVGRLLGTSIGIATMADVAFAYHANGIGTSYITEPEEMLGSLRIGSSLFNVSCDRSAPGSIGRVRWDDEGVTPLKYNLITNGVLTNLQTNREGAAWIKSHLRESNQSYRSFGSAGSASALDPQTIQAADLSLKPGSSGSDLDHMRKELRDGIELRLPRVEMDFQQSTGMISYGRAYEIKNGKRVARLANAAVLFRTYELWANLVHLGGKNSVRYSSHSIDKGQPVQRIYSGLYTPPAIFKEMTFIDRTRKA